MTPATRLMFEKLTALSEQGLSYAEAAVAAGCSYKYVAGFIVRHEIKFRTEKRGPKRTGPDKRSEQMRALYVGGKTLADIGNDFGVTRERVRQILNKHYGIRAQDGGQSIAMRKKRCAINKARDARSLKLWGCDYREYRRILKHPDQPTRAYSAQRKNTHSRELEWKLSLWQWWKIWEQSGHWSDRGRGRGYCMCRLNDIGPYSIDNVYIATNAENVQDYWADVNSGARTRVYKTRSAPVLGAAA